MKFYTWSATVTREHFENIPREQAFSSPFSTADPALAAPLPIIGPNPSSARARQCVASNVSAPHTTLTKARNGYTTTPTMAAGVADHVWTLREVAGLHD